MFVNVICSNGHKFIMKFYVDRIGILARLGLWQPVIFSLQDSITIVIDRGLAYAEFRFFLVGEIKKRIELVVLFPVFLILSIIRVKSLWNWNGSLGDKS